MKKILPVILFTVLFLISLFAAAGAQPVETIIKFLQSKTYEETKSYTCCSMNSIYLEPEFKKQQEDGRQYGAPYEISSTDSSSIVVVPVKTMDDSVNINIDFYYYLVNSSGEWKIEEQRFRPVYDYLTIMAMVEYSRLTRTESDPANVYPERFLLFNSSQEKLIKYFNDNRERFNALLNDAANLAVKDTLADLEEVYSEIPPRVKDLYIAAIFKDNYLPFKAISTPGITFFEIENSFGGTGYLHTKSKSMLPENNTILITGELGGGWYIYKSFVDLKDID